MSSGAHLSKQMQQLVKSIGETKSKQQQDRIIELQLTNLKPKLNQKNLTPKKLKQLLIRAIYIEMLGFSASFAYIHAINLTQNKNLIMKRLGYLLCSLFMNKDSELIIMLVSTIQKDLNSSDVHQIVISLTSLGNIMNSTIAQAIIQPVTKLLSHTTDLVRKKALLILQKIQLISPNLVEDYKQKLKKALCDREPSVMSTALNLYIQQVKINPKKYKDLAPSFVIILKQVIEHKLPKQFDYHRLPAPWIQIKLLNLIQMLAKNDLKASQHCYTILQQALKRAIDGRNNISFAVTYQCIKTIAGIYPNKKLIQQAATSLQQFLISSNNSLKFMGIQLLGQLYKQYPNLLNEHQLTIVDCLESPDETLKRQTLQLLYHMTNPQNIQITVSKMLESLHSSTDNYFRNALVLKITQLSERFAPTHQWYLDTMQLLFQLGSQYLTDQVLNNFLKLVIQNFQENKEVAPQLIDKMINLLQKVTPTDFILKISSWIIGELGSSYYFNNPQKIVQLCNIVLKSFQNDFQQKNTKVWLIDAIVKLSSTKDFKEHNQVKILLQKCGKDKDLQIYNRSLESKKLAKYNTALKKHFEVNFEQQLSFLDGYVQTALKNGAKPYQKTKSRQTADIGLRFKAYEQKIQTKSSFPFKKQQQKKIQPSIFQQPKAENKITQPIYEKPKPKKEFVSPQQINKKKLANKLFGNTSKPTTTVQKIVTPTGKQQPKKKTQTIDLI